MRKSKDSWVYNFHLTKSVSTNIPSFLYFVATFLLYVQIGITNLKAGIGGGRGCLSFIVRFAMNGRVFYFNNLPIPSNTTTKRKQ